MGFAGACSHVADVGGSIAPDARDVYEEGICFPPVKLYRAGERDSVIFRIIEKNVRVPEQVLGDLDALVASCHASAAQLVALMDETGHRRPAAALEDAGRAHRARVPEGGRGHSRRHLQRAASSPTVTRSPVTLLLRDHASTAATSTSIAKARRRR